MNPYQSSRTKSNKLSSSAPIHEDAQGELKSGKEWIATGIVIGVIANVGALGSILPLVAVPTGSAIRPMGAFGSAFCFWMLGVGIGLPTCLAGMYFKRSGRDAFGWIGVGVNVCSLVLTILAIDLICWARDLTILE